MLDKLHQKVQDSIDLPAPGKEVVCIDDNIFDVIETQLVRDLGYKPGLLRSEDAALFERHYNRQGQPLRQVKEPIEGYFDGQFVTVGKVRLWSTYDGKNADTLYILLQNDIDAIPARDIGVDYGTISSSIDRTALPKDIAGVFLHESGLIQAMAAPCDYLSQELPAWFPTKRKNTLPYPESEDEIRQVITKTLEEKTALIRAGHIGSSYEPLDPLFIERLSILIFMLMKAYRSVVNS
jgi:hypothetical protein